MLPVEIIRYLYVTELTIRNDKHMVYITIFLYSCTFSYAQLSIGMYVKTFVPTYSVQKLVIQELFFETFCDCGGKI